MANRYWVGGSGTWDTTSTTNWSTASGGASGASVPTAADSVFFDQAGTYTVTCTGALTCLDFTVSAGTVTFSTGTTPNFSISGSMTLLAGTVWNLSNANITFVATSTGKTVTTNGTTINGRIRFNGTGGEWSLGSALTVADSLSQGVGVQEGTFNTNGYNLTTTVLTSAFTTPRTLNLSSSTVVITAQSNNAFIINTLTNLTFNAGTSQINFTGAISSGIAVAVGLTFYNVAFTSTTARTNPITGANTFNNLAITAPSAAGVATVTFDSQQTINGTLSTTGTAGNQRVFFSSATYGIAVDLVVNSAPSLTDADFRGLYVRGTSAPISGTRIGNRGECRGITFSTPKTVYWNLAGINSSVANGWATAPTGTPSTDNFPLPQDTATFTNSGAGTEIAYSGVIPFISNLDMSALTNAMTLRLNGNNTAYGNITLGAGVTVAAAGTQTFSGGSTQTITSAGKAFTCPIIVDTYGGTVQLADALNIGTNNLVVTNGTFNTQGYAVTANSLSSSNSNVRTIILGASTVTLLSAIVQLNFTSKINLTFNAGTSNILITTAVSGSGTLNLNGLIFNNFTYTNTASFQLTITGENTFNNLTFNGTSSPGILQIVFQNNQTINGTLTCAGATAVRRIFLLSNTIGTQRTLTVNSISATDCDFRDINLAGTASGASPTRAGDCGNNAGITFPASKTVYWNLTGAQNWSATGWATLSGGTPAVNNFPLAQDTAVFDNTGSVTGTITIDAAWNIGTFDASARTSAMTFTTGTNAPIVYGDWKFGTGVTSSSTPGAITFAKNGTQTITSNGIQFGCPVTVNHPSGTVQLADALSLGSTRTLTLTAGTFDAATYNVTTGLFSNGSTANTLKMGSGTWTISGNASTSVIWNATTAPILIVGTSTIVLSDTSSTFGRIFQGGGLYYNKLTIGGTTGTSNLIITGANTFGELASTKTVAHTITFPSSTTTTIGKWSVTGTAGNVVTLAPSTAATTYTISIAGPANSGIDYLSVSYCAVSTTSPGEFYVGVNSTNTAGNTGAIIFTATPAARTLYWVGGTGNWSSTTKWSTSSGGASGAAIPTSLDAVNFDSASNATAYTATIDAGVTIARCASFTMAGPASGNVTFAGGVQIAIHGSVSFTATGITRTYTGNMFLAGNSSYTITTNGISLASAITITGISSTWTLGSALTNSNSLTVTYGSFNTSSSNYAASFSALSSSNSFVRSISLNASSVSLSGNLTLTTATNLTWSAGTSTVSSSSSNPTLGGGGLSFYNISFTSNSASAVTITEANTFNNLTFTGRTSVGITPVTFNANQTISGTLTLGAGTAAAYRTFLASDTIGTTRTLTVNSLAAGAADIDFRDITIAGAAAPISGTRFGDAKGNSGITFPAAKTVYYRSTGSTNWGTTGTGSWSATSGGAADATQFPLAQDMAVFPAATYPTSGSTTTVNANYNIGTIDMSLRTASTMTLDTSVNAPQIYGNWINGTGTTLSGAGTLTFAGRTTQQITSAGRQFVAPVTILTIGGSVTLTDAFSISNNLFINGGTFSAASYNLTTSSTSASVAIQTSRTRSVDIGSGTWTLAGSSAWNVTDATNLTITGTGTISATSASAKTFAGGSLSYSGITLNQGGAGTLTITGNNTFKDITNTYSATGANTISFGATTTTLTQFTGTGAAAKLLTLSGTSAASPATLILSSGTVTTPDYLTISNVRAYSLSSTWYAGANSVNSGSLGWIFAASGGVTYNSTITESATSTDSISAAFLYLSDIAESVTATDSTSASFLFLGAIAESVTATDEASALAIFVSTAAETATATDLTDAPGSTYNPTISETSTATDTISVAATFESSLNEISTITDSVSAAFLAFSTVSEVTTATDAIDSLMAFASFVDETSTATDSTVGYITFPASISETSTATDAISAQATFISSISESGTVTDSTVGYITFPANISETATSTETVVGYISFPADIAESLSASDLTSSVFAFGANISETVTATDAASSLVVFFSTVSETATATDSTSSAAAFAVSLSETATATDATSSAASFASTVLETSTSTDSTSAAASFASTISESGTATNTASVTLTLPSSISETATGTDSTSSLPIYATTILESTTASDTSSALAGFASSILETATATDDVNAPGSTYNPSIAETSTASDAVVGYITFPASVTETATATDEAASFIIFISSVTETATSTDETRAQQDFDSRIAEAGAATDAPTVAPSTFNAPVTEFVTALDSPSALGIFNSAVVESPLIYDTVIGVYQWNPIPTSQPGAWQNITSGALEDAVGVAGSAVSEVPIAGGAALAGVAAWQVFETEQIGEWQTVQTNSNGGWQLIDDSQPGAWQNTLTVQ